jgi:hypothetical protein
VRRFVAALAGTIGCSFVFVGLASVPIAFLAVVLLPYPVVVLLLLLMFAVAVHVGRMIYRVVMRAGEHGLQDTRSPP